LGSFDPANRGACDAAPLSQATFAVGTGLSDAGGGFVTLQWCDLIRRASFNQLADDLELEAVVARTRSKKIR
jgi:hypothetical protein